MVDTNTFQCQCVYGAAVSIVPCLASSSLLVAVDFDVLLTSHRSMDNLDAVAILIEMSL